jgi:hypothetical protein
MLMKKVFEAKMEIEFVDSVSSNGMQKEYEFSSSNGITGTLSLSEVSQINDKTVKSVITVMTERKRMYPDFESYLELIKTTVGGKNSISKLSDIVTKTCRTLDKCSLICKMNGLSIMEDEDSCLYVVDEKSQYQKVINSFDNFKEAMDFIENKTI